MKADLYNKSTIIYIPRYKAKERILESIILPISGSVTLNSIRLSGDTNTAFVDFSSQGLLTPYLGRLLTVTDSGGKQITGYIRAAGTGETFASPVVSTDMESGSGDPFLPTGWVNLSSVAGELAQSVVVFNSPTHSLEINTPSANHGLQIDFPQVVARAYKYSVYLQRVSGSLKWADLYNGLGASLLSRSIVSGSSTLTQDSVYFTSTATGPGTNSIAVYSMGGGAVFFLDDIVMAQLITPSITGVTITTLPGGTNFNWAFIQGGFNWLDSSGYTYTITMP